MPDSIEIYGQLQADLLQHCEMQLWTPDDMSEAHLYLNDENHGRAISSLKVDDGPALVSTVAAACALHDDFQKLSAVRFNYPPIVLLACRHWRLPIPPQFYIGSLKDSPNIASAVTRPVAGATLDE